MRCRIPLAGRVLGTVILLGTSAGACASGGAPGAPGHFANPAPGTGYTSDQLQQALLTEVSGYQRAGEPDSGEYGSLEPIQNFNQLQTQAKLDKPQCAATGQGFEAAQQAAPAAITTFTTGSGQSFTETLMRVSAGLADRELKVRVSPDCQRFRARVDGQWSDHYVVEATSGRLGTGSRTVGVATTSGTSHVKTWYVVLKSRGYLATITLYGPNVTRAEAEQIARQAYDQAERILP
ncbi:MAG: hypothetical protein JWO67_1799 [Streptosporangiaceae bacterium]|nr:hypothetical protein [Streptosporangiaceae bacterium]